MARQLVTPPQLPPTPRTLPEVVEWIDTVSRSLNRYFSDMAARGTDYRLFGVVSRQVVVAGFTVAPVGPFIELFADVDVVSDAIVAIKAGDNGQWLVIQNRSVHIITIKTGALTLLSPPIDYAMAPDDTLTVRWDSSKWVEIGRNA